MNDPAMIKSGYERLENDAYYTRDIVCLDALMWGMGGFSGVKSNTFIWEPFGGGGHITNYLENRNFKVVSTDINPTRDGIKQLDYYKNKKFYTPYRHCMVVSNPPFEKKLAEEFVRDMVENCKSSSGDFTACVLLRNEWDSAGTRLDIFDSPYFYKKIVITQRPRWMKVTKDSSSPRHNYSWFIFTNIEPDYKSEILHYHPSKDPSNYEKVGRKYKRKYPEAGLEYIY